jgi:D-sedoheptulose 7-phosphate isomerase
MKYKENLEQRQQIFDDVISNHLENMKQLADILFYTIKSDHKVMAIGNGGSAANAQHITGDIIGRYKLERQGFPAVSLTVDPSVMTATANDYGYENVFARQVEGLGKKGDLLIVLSSSANSRNILKAVEKAKNLGIKTIGILGNNGGMITNELDFSIDFDFNESDLVEETAMAIFHIILMEVEEKLVNLEKDDLNVN